MSLNHSPAIVTDGLVFCLDAGNSRSYPKSGTTWTDLKGSNNATLNNGPAFDSANRGSITTDGTNDYIDTGYHIPKSDATIDIIFKRNTTGGNFKTLWGQNNALLTQGFGLVTNATILDSNLYFIYGTGSAYRLTRIANPVTYGDNIHHVTMCSDFTTNSSFKVMVNGSIVVDLTPNVAEGVTNVSSSEGVHLGGSRVSSYYEDHNFYSFKVYNRLLSEEEMLQNYEATVGRYT